MPMWQNTYYISMIFDVQIFGGRKQTVRKERQKGGKREDGCNK
jgi:hypothetical protein